VPRPRGLGPSYRFPHPPPEVEGLRPCARLEAQSSALPPVEVEELSLGDYHYRLHHGAHRFFASVAVGFTHIPARLRL
jgi:hypothetical protein